MQSRFSRVFRYLPPILWMGLIFLVSSSSDPYKVALPSQWEATCAQSFHGSWIGQLACHNDFIGNCAHIFEYAVLAILLAIAFSPPRQERVIKLLLLAFLISILYALSDETHQFFVYNRAFQFQDLGLDTIGALIGVMLFAGKRKISRN
jgi:VanZ family protein